LTQAVLADALGSSQSRYARLERPMRQSRWTCWSARCRRWERRAVTWPGWSKRG